MLERKYAQLKEEIRFYEKETQRKRWPYAIKIALLLVLISRGAELLFAISFDGQSLEDWLNGQRWIKMLTSFLFWLVVIYFWQVKENHRQLTTKQQEMQKLLQQNPSLKETAA